MSKWRRRGVWFGWLVVWCALDVWLVRYGPYEIIAGKYVCAQAFAGLGGKRWLHGLWLAFGLWALSALTIGGMAGMENLDELLLAPLALLVGAFPLWVLRFGRGWMLTSADADPVPPLRIADLITVTALLPATMSFVPIFCLLQRLPPSNWQNFAITSVTGFLAGFLLVPLVIWLLRTCQNNGLASVGVSLAIVSGGVALWAALDEAGGLLSFLSVGLPLLLLTALRLAGMRFMRVVERPLSGDNVGSDAQSLWLTVAAAVVVAVALNLISSRIQAWRVEERQLVELARRHSGNLQKRDESWLSLGPTATNDDLRRFLRYRDLQHLNLSGRHFNDETLRIVSQFSALEGLTLRGTEITDEGLEQLRVLSRLSQLSLGGCRIRGDRLPKVSSLKQLDLTGTQVSNHVVRQLSRLPLLDLSLADTAVDDAAFDGVQFAHVVFLDLTKTQVTGRTLHGCTALQIFLANESFVDDAGVAVLSANTQVKHLELARTRVTDEVVASLVTLPNLDFVDLAGTTFSNAGLARLTAGDRLVRPLDSPLLPPGTFSLILTGTRITDDGLCDLAKLNFRFAELTDTSVTSAAILRAPGLRGRGLRIGPHQFTENERAQLKAFCNLQ